MKRRKVMIILAIVLAFIGVGAVYSYLSGTDARVLAGKQATSVLMVAKRIPAGTSLKDITDGGYVRQDSVPASAKPADAVTQLSDVASTDVALADVPSGQIVVRDMFGKITPTTSGLTIPDGMVAISITVSSSADVAGYVQPGSEIAIFDTYVMLNDKGAPVGNKGNAEKADNWATKLLLPRVKVLAVSQAAPSETKQATQSDSLLVTIAVSQIDAERVVHVTQTGVLYLALLTDRSKTAPSPGIDNQGKLGGLFGAGAAPGTSAP
ncbi:MAG TPA: Flp pilus assembly protein CpaB [Jatrophihabitantaceae bacterium]|nr:Flp pilus assembly protein CpaB [Jatrophihabitantaceae bacterium]